MVMAYAYIGPWFKPKPHRIFPFTSGLFTTTMVINKLLFINSDCVYKPYLNVAQVWLANWFKLVQTRPN